MYARIVVPLDGSDLAASALPKAEEMARVFNAPIHIVRVIDYTNLQQYGPYGLAIEYAGLPQVLAEEQRVARDYTTRIERELSDRGARVTTELRTGDSAREIIAAAGADDLIVMASHGRTGLARWFLGSVAEDVVRRAHGPVLLVRSVPNPAAAPAAKESPATGATSS